MQIVHFVRVKWLIPAHAYMFFVRITCMGYVLVVYVYVYLIGDVIFPSTVFIVRKKSPDTFRKQFVFPFTQWQRYMQNDVVI